MDCFSLTNPTFEAILYEMKQISDPIEISAYLSHLRAIGKTIGFVPTMGALHKGHLSLIQQAKSEVDIVVCSIFVNPLQFNRKEDLENYPNRMNEDRELLMTVDCDLLFTPTREGLYPKSPKMEFNFGSIGKGMEADFRPDHFEGVAAAIERFLEILNPHKAYFGEKDYQQLAIVRWLTKNRGFETTIVGCETIRNENGLAMSSRNYLLDQEELKTAAKIYKSMLYAKTNKHKYGPKDLGEKCFEMLEEDFQTEYFIIADAASMKPLNSWNDSENPRAFVAAYLSGVRLIDNLSLNS